MLKMGTTNQRQDFHRANSNKIEIKIRTGSWILMDKGRLVLSKL